MQITYAGTKVVVFAFHSTGITQALFEAARVILEYKADPVAAYEVDEKAVTLDTDGVHGFEITLPLVRKVHRCKYGDTNGDGDCPHGFTEFEVIGRG